MSIYIQNFGISGANSADLIAKQLPKAEDFKPTLTILLIGTNDAGNKDALLPHSVFRKNYREILRRLNALGTRVIAMTVPPLIDRAFRATFGEEPFGGYMPNERVIAENVIIREEAARAGAALVDIFEDFSRTDLESEAGYLFHRRNAKSDDGCHPTLFGYRRMAALLVEKIKEINADTSRIACLGDSITFGAFVAPKGGADRHYENYPGLLSVLLDPENGVARERTDFLEKAIIYQMSLRAFTEEGTLKAAEKRLCEVSKTSGADIIYLLPIVEADRDENRDFWSKRQKASGCENPRNPYRISDYYKIDPEYGNEGDLRSFVQTAHSLGLKVMLDLVYLHAGPSFAKRHPAFVRHAPDGTPINGAWSFPELDFANPQLREYLWQNMEYFVREFGVDGYRCDVGDWVPLDFWEEGRRRIEAIKPDVFMLNEGERQHHDDQRFAFDLNYSFSLGLLPKVINGDLAAYDIEVAVAQMTAFKLKNSRFIRCYDNHDIATDAYEQRLERLFGEYAINMLLACCYMIGGTPMIYNGCEFCDSGRSSLFANKGQYVINRNGNSVARQALLLKLAALFKSEEALHKGLLLFVKNNYPRTVLTFVREARSGRKIFVMLNFSARSMRVKPGNAEFLKGETLISQAAGIIDGEVELNSYGFIAIGI